MFVSIRAAAYLSAILISGCASLPDAPPVAAVGIDGERCVGLVPTAVAGLTAAGNAALLEKAQSSSGKGGVCAAGSFAVAAPVAVYRVYDGAKPWSAYGGWWAMERPQGPKADYRAKNAICAEWSQLDRLISCRMKVGAEIVLGTTQSATCADGGTYPKTAEIQVYVPNDQRNGVLHVEDCREEGEWPAAEAM